MTTKVQATPQARNPRATKAAGQLGTSGPATISANFASFLYPSRRWVYQLDATWRCLRIPAAVAPGQIADD